MQDLSFLTPEAAHSNNNTDMQTEIGWMKPCFPIGRRMTLSFSGFRKGVPSKPCPAVSSKSGSPLPQGNVTSTYTPQKSVSEQPVYVGARNVIYILLPALLEEGLCFPLFYFPSKKKKMHTKTQIAYHIFVP